MRMLGEVCHFVDTAEGLIGAEIEEVDSVLGGQGPGLVGDDGVVTLRFANGSLAAICYGNAVPSAGKEWIEVSAGAHRLVIDDFRAALLDGQALWKGRQDNRHLARASGFWQVVSSSETASPTDPMIATMRATLQAAALERPSSFLEDS